eukprot:8926974-Pyramimonas_sp.AAC.1
MSAAKSAEREFEDNLLKYVRELEKVDTSDYSQPLIHPLQPLILPYGGAKRQDLKLGSEGVATHGHFAGIVG